LPGVGGDLKDIGRHTFAILSCRLQATPSDKGHTAAEVLRLAPDEAWRRVPPTPYLPIGATARCGGIGLTDVARSGQSVRVDGRPPTSDEMRLLSSLLAHDVEGAAALREQLLEARIVPSCSCGCGSIAFVFDDHATAPPKVSTLFPIEGEILDDGGNVIGGLLLFVRDGRLDDIDVYSYNSDPLPLPDVERLRWVARS
jgi:hypothetical protein